MTDRILTDDEVRDIACNKQVGIALARVVEAAVLQRCVTERAARKRERAAFDAGAAWQKDANTLWLGGGQGFSGTFNAPKYHKAKDELYPLPKRIVPRTVTLSDGTRVFWDNTHNRFGSNQDFLALNVYTYAKTPADARALADLVEHPTMEVDDD